MTNDIDDSILAQWLSASGQFSAPLDDEMKAAFYLRSAIDKIKPSNIYALAKLSNCQSHFADLLMQACLACAMPSEAESIAGQAVDSFDLNKQAGSADAVWQLILLVAAQAACPEDDWVEASATCQRACEATSAPHDLLSSLLSRKGTWPVASSSIWGEA